MSIEAAGNAKPASKSETRLKVFISYSRGDSIAFADQLAVALEAYGYEATIDRHGIAGGEDWKKRLGGLILEADTVVFVLSPRSAVSEVCAWEVAEADRKSKRIIPIVAMPLEAATPPPRLQNLNYIYFYPEPSSPGTGFGQGLASLVTALNSDLDWLREHTVITMRAAVWNERGRQADRLIRGSLLAEAERWVASRPANAPDIGEQVRAYLDASRQIEDASAAAAVKQLQEMAAAQAERQKAIEQSEANLKLAEQAQKDREAEQKLREAEQARRARMGRFMVAGASLAAIAFAVFGVVSWRLRGQAVDARDAAEQARAEAVMQTERARDFQQSLNKRVEELKATNVRLNRKMGLRIAPYGDKPQTINDGWFKIATDYTGAVATVENKKNSGQGGGTGFAIRGGALHEPWGDETVFVTTSFNLLEMAHASSQGSDDVTSDMLATAQAYFHGPDSGDKKIAFSKVLWHESEVPPNGSGISILRIDGSLPFGVQRIERINTQPSPELPTIDMADNDSGQDIVAKGGARILATIGNPIAQGGFSLIVSHLLGVNKETATGANKALVYTYATGPGAAGGPIFDIATGELLAIHQSGSFSSRKVRVGWGVSVQSLIGKIKADPDWLLEKAAMAKTDGKLQLAIQALDAYLVQQTARGGDAAILARAYFERGKYNYETGNRTAGDEDFRQAAARGTDIATHFITDGEGYIPSANYAAARDAFTSAIEWAAGKPQTLEKAYAGRGKALYGLGERDKAKADFDKAPSQASDIAQRLLVEGENRAQAANEDDLRRAIVAFSDAIDWAQRAGPDKSIAGRAYLARATAALTLGQTDQAEGDFRQARELGQDAIKTLLDGAAGAIETGKDQDAEAAYAIAARVDPGAGERIKQSRATGLELRKTVEASKHNGTAWDLLIKGQAGDGLPEIEKAVSIAPFSAAFIDTRAQIYLALDRFDEALADFDRAIARGLRTPSTYYGRARCHETKGNMDAAVADYLMTLEQTIQGDYAYNEDAQTKARERLAALGVPIPAEDGPRPP